MAAHERFNFNSLDDIQRKSRDLGLSLSFPADLSSLHRKVKVGSLTAPNAVAVLPMEGCDSLPDGGPSELVKRRYFRFARGGAGLVWWEANAVVREGRANELQMMLTPENLLSFKELVRDTRLAGKERNGNDYRPLYILQLTHSGRYSRPLGHKPAPIIPQHDPVLDPRTGVTAETPLVSDEYLESLVEKYAAAARLAREAGFDGVDVKACHRYLLSELLASHTRQGPYGGSYENRSRLIISIIHAIRKACGKDFIIASRFNVFDAHPYPYGFGEDEKDFMKFDSREPEQLVRDLCGAGIDLLSNSAGNPYYIYPQVTRPFDKSSLGIPIPGEHPLESIERLFAFTALVQKSSGGIPVVGNGYTWLRQFMPNAGAANIAAGNCAFLGLGRSSFAYPDAPYDMLNTGALKPEKCCITCSACTQIMRDHGCTGCVIRDGDVYGPIYQQARNDAEKREQPAGEQAAAQGARVAEISGQNAEAKQ
jgi:2,4-dienoyl-CoA reductase-like NADH-dependent reductase (Old Yellow Enzyme family)